MPLYTIEIFAIKQAQEVATRQAIAGILNKNPRDLKMDSTKVHAGTVRLVADLNDGQRQSIVSLSGVQTVRPV